MGIYSYSEFSIENCDFPIKNCDFPIKNVDFPSDFPINFLLTFTRPGTSHWFGRHPNPLIRSRLGGYSNYFPEAPRYKQVGEAR